MSKREIEYEIYKVCTGHGPRAICPHTEGVEIYVDYCVELETADRVAQRVLDNNRPGRCQMRPEVYLVNKAFVKINPQTGEPK